MSRTKRYAAIALATTAIAVMAVDTGHATTTWATKKQMQRAALTLAEANAAYPSQADPAQTAVIKTTDTWQAHGTQGSPLYVLGLPDTADFARGWTYSGPVPPAEVAGVELVQFANSAKARKAWNGITGKINGAKMSITRSDGVFTRVWEIPNGGSPIYSVLKFQPVGRLIVGATCGGSDAAATTACSTALLAAQSTKSQPLQ